MKFSELALGDEFEVWGDQLINYGHHKICRCEKINEATAREILVQRKWSHVDHMEYGQTFAIAQDATVVLCSDEPDETVLLNFINTHQHVHAAPV